jgi:hypothetical protein
MLLMRVALKRDEDIRDTSQLMDVWLGGTERIVALTLFVLSQANLPWFIGAWVAAKYALNWNRWPMQEKDASTARAATAIVKQRSAKEELADAAQGGLLALIGNVLSFGIAIAAGFFFVYVTGGSTPFRE